MRIGGILPRRARASRRARIHDFEPIGIGEAPTLLQKRDGSWELKLSPETHSDNLLQLPLLPPHRLPPRCGAFSFLDRWIMDAAVSARLRRRRRRRPPQPNHERPRRASPLAGAGGRPACRLGGARPLAGAQRAL